MLRKYSNSRTVEDNIRLGVLTAITAGMVNVASLIIFFSFTSNVTGHYAILASEIVNGNVYQIFMVLSWLLLFFLGGVVSNLVVINLTKKNSYLAHAIPIVLEIMCLMAVGYYCIYHYNETLIETEILVCLLIFAMGLQNGLTASISNFAVKTTHLTGTTTDLSLLVSMFTKKEYRRNQDLVNRAKLLFAIMVSYVFGATTAGMVYFYVGYYIFYFVSMFLVVVLAYDWYVLFVKRYLANKTRSFQVFLKFREERRMTG